MPDGAPIRRMIWLNRLLRDDRAPTRVHKLAHLIADHINSKTNDAWAAQTTWAQQLGVSPKTVQRGVKVLEALGYLVVVRKGQRGATNRYRLRLPNPECEAAGQSQSGHSCPFMADTDVRQSNLNKSVELADTNNSSSRTTPRIGFGGAKRRRTPLPSSRDPCASSGPLMRDRGTYEARIAKRLGEEGYDLLNLLPDREVQRLCEMERGGRLSDAGLLDIRLKAIKAREAR